MLKIKELRSERGISLRELSNQLEISYSSLGKYERGEQQPNIDTLIKLANYFNVSVDYLIGNSNYKTTQDEYKFKSSFDELEDAVSIDLYNAIIDCLTSLSSYYKKNPVPEHHPSLSFIFINHLASILSGYNTLANDLQNGSSLEKLVLEAAGSEITHLPTEAIIKELLVLFNKT
ncbi:helix-turn-helix domain-containing protein [Enterocloster aldenensis]|uniref:helix-turn-helix domain-containing protein n=1 Tax=Enterocloster aldenensis TaxID=358742 RepID=UPI00402A3FC7